MKGAWNSTLSTLWRPQEDLKELFDTEGMMGGMASDTLENFKESTTFDEDGLATQRIAAEVCVCVCLCVCVCVSCVRVRVRVCADGVVFVVHRRRGLNPYLLSARGALPTALSLPLCLGVSACLRFCICIVTSVSVRLSCCGCR